MACGRFTQVSAESAPIGCADSPGSIIIPGGGGGGGAGREAYRGTCCPRAGRAVLCARLRRAARSTCPKPPDYGVKPERLHLRLRGDDDSEPIMVCY